MPERAQQSAWHRQLLNRAAVAMTSFGTMESFNMEFSLSFLICATGIILSTSQDLREY